MDSAPRPYFLKKQTGISDTSSLIYCHLLVGGLEHFLFFHILGMSSSQLTNSNLFQRGRVLPPTTSIDFA